MEIKCRGCGTTAKGPANFCVTSIGLSCMDLLLLFLPRLMPHILHLEDFIPEQTATLFTRQGRNHLKYNCYSAVPRWHFLCSVLFFCVPFSSCSIPPFWTKRLCVCDQRKQNVSSLMWTSKWHSVVMQRCLFSKDLCETQFAYKATSVHFVRTRNFVLDSPFVLVHGSLQYSPGTGTCVHLCVVLGAVELLPKKAELSVSTNHKRVKFPVVHNVWQAWCFLTKAL